MIFRCCIINFDSRESYHFDCSNMYDVKFFYNQFKDLYEFSCFLIDGFDCSIEIKVTDINYNIS